MGADPRSDFAAAHTYSGRPLGRPLPIPATVIEMLTAQAAARPEAPYLTAVRGGAETTLGYGETERDTRALAAALPARPGDVVGVLAVNDAPTVLALLGVLRAGCSVLVLDPASPPARLESLTAALGAGLVVAGTPEVAERWPGARVVTPDDPPQPGRGSLPDPAREADAFFLGTSGTTATSKLVAQSHYAAAVNAVAVSRHHGVTAADRVLGCLPVSHVNSLHLTLLAPLAVGAHGVLAPEFEPFDYLRLVERSAPRVASVVPSILEVLRTTARGRRLDGALHHFVSAAAPLAAGTARAVTEHLGVRVLQGYGLTETVNFATTVPAGLEEADYRRLVTEADIPSIGVALYGNDVAVLRDDGSVAEPGEVGEICIRGHNVMTRYAGNPAASADAFRHGWFHSEDLGYAQPGPGGEPCFTITGRRKSIAKVRGATVSLDELDRALLALPGVRDAATVAAPDPFEGEVIVAAVVLDAEVADGALRDGLRRILPESHLPRRFVRRNRIPRTATGKLQRPRLAAELQAEPPATPR